MLLSGLLWHGTPHTLFNQARAGTVELVMNQTLMEEFAETITHRKFAAILQRTTRTPERILHELQALAEMVVAPPCRSRCAVTRMMMRCWLVRWPHRPI